MSSALFEFATNSSFFDVFAIYWKSVSLYVTNKITSLRDNNNQSLLFSIFDNSPESLFFNEFQLTLLKIFAGILLVNLLFIAIAWKVYGEKICERFMQPGESPSIFSFLEYSYLYNVIKLIKFWCNSHQ